MAKDFYIKCVNNENEKTDAAILTYQIHDSSKKPLLNSKCSINQGRIHSIEFFEINTNRSLIALQRTNNAPETYAVVDDLRDTTILKTEQGWKITTKQGTICDVILKKEKVHVIALILLTILDILYLPTLPALKTQIQYMFYMEEEDELLGTFFFNLSNLYITDDGDGILDVYTALAQAILIDFRRKNLSKSE